MPAAGVAGISGIAGHRVAVGVVAAAVVVIVAIAAGVHFVAVRVVLVHLVVFAIAFVASEQDVRVLLEILLSLNREPLGHFDGFLRHSFESRIGLRRFRNCTLPMSNERHADSRQTLRRSPGAGVITFPQ